LNGHTWGYINFLVVHAYIAFFAHLDDVWIQILTMGYIKYTSNFLGGNTRLEVWDPRNHACDTRVHRPPWHTQRPLPTWPKFQVRARCRITPIQFSKVHDLEEWPSSLYSMSCGLSLTIACMHAPLPGKN
jgi:hypothetical protein